MRYLIGLTILSFVPFAGCNSRDKEKNPATIPSAAKHDHEHDGHDDEDNVAHAGPYHVKLTAHLSEKEGNELDLRFETTAEKPYAVSTEKILAKAKRAGDDKEYDLTFTPAPADERQKDEATGTCSHFVAKAPFMKETDLLTVTFKVVIRDRERSVAWEKPFDVKKFSHKHE